jgi:hypothetical protein
MSTETAGDGTSHSFLLSVRAAYEYGKLLCNFNQGPKQAFLGTILYNRVWFHKDLYAVTLGGGAITNPGRKREDRFNIALLVKL